MNLVGSKQSPVHYPGFNHDVPAYQLAFRLHNFMLRSFTAPLPSSGLWLTRGAATVIKGVAAMDVSPTMTRGKE